MATASGDEPAPRATYRVQLHAGFGFDDVAAIAGYLADLGVSHVYCSPYLQAAVGSTHGYDVVDHSRLNVELGGTEAFDRMTQALAAAGLSQVADIVPNHMAAVGGQNRWWWDVLENGPSSRWADAFDIDWGLPPSEGRPSGRGAGGDGTARVLLPILGDHYGRLLEAGELSLAREGASFVVRYADHTVPVSPRTLDTLLGRAADRCGSEELATLATALGRLPPATATDRASLRERHRDKQVLGSLLARLLRDEPAVAAAVDGTVSVTNADPDALDVLLARQNYRLAYWRVASEELDYRRFFDITSLVGLRMELPHVFDETHELILGLVADGTVTGLRVDHPDGLRDPEAYLWRLFEAAGGTWVVVEKILEPGEELPPTWPVAGTTGYDFLNLAGGLFVDPDGEEPLTELHERFTDTVEGYADVVRQTKHLVMKEALAADLRRVVDLAVAVCGQDRRYRDYTRPEVSRALAELVACFPVYRTYVRPGHPASDVDVAHVAVAAEEARTRRPDLDPELFAFLTDVLLLRVPSGGQGPSGPLSGGQGPSGPLSGGQGPSGPLSGGQGPSGPLSGVTAATELALRFQQLTGPVMAKGAEDTAFYSWRRLMSLNEVGGDPARFGTTVAEFHQSNRRAAVASPRGLLALSTHDSKRSADVRARIGLLSEIPGQWALAVRRWSAMNEAHKTDGLPDRGAEYLLYQTLVGAWPLPADRAVAFMEKASREAKEHTSWTRPDPAYDRALADFVEAVVADPAFAADLDAFAAPLVTPGRVTSLAQVLLAVTCPGVPDFYQGSELWDLSLVDPDNRRPVDYETRRRMLEKVASAGPATPLRGPLGPADVWPAPVDDEGAVKLWLVHRALQVRRTRVSAFAVGSSYEALPPAGGKADHAVAFCRGGQVAVVVPRLVVGLGGDWADTTVTLPPGRWTDALGGPERPSERGGGETVDGGPVPLAGLLARFPLALMVVG